MTKIFIAIQARSNSARLPFKSLLSVCGMPLAILAAKRAANTGLDVTLLTSREASDDELANACQLNSVKFFRGDLDNVLNRFAEFAEDKQDDDAIVRLTADNLFPDGNFLDNFLKFYLSQNARYIYCDQSQMPYGLSAEAFRIKDLRAAKNEAVDPFDLEHVTPWLKKNVTSITYAPEKFKMFMGLRCTIDTNDDFIRMTKIFRKHQALDVPHMVLCQDLLASRGSDE